MINKAYATTKAIKQISTILASEGAVTLPTFFQTIPQKPRTYMLVEKRLTGVFEQQTVSKHIQELLKQYVQFCLGKEVVCVHAKHIRLSHKHYSLLDDSVVAKKSSVDVFIELTPRWIESYGGMPIFEGEEPLTVTSQINTMTIILSSHKRSFYSYVNHTAKKKKHEFIHCTFTV
jgi:hypothetical protein